jgi:hypothetical protein
MTVTAGAGQMLSVAVPALDSLSLLLYVWALVASGWLLVRGSRTAPSASPEPVAA